jgi:hypothetical protein
MKRGTLLKVRDDHKGLFITLFWKGIVHDYVYKSDVIITLDSSDKDYHEVFVRGMRGFLVKGLVEVVG